MDSDAMQPTVARLHGEEPTSGSTGSPERPIPPEHQKVSLRLIISDPPVRTVLLIIFVIMLGFGIIAPILPLYARSFGVSYGTASLLISAFAFARLITDPVVGPIVDRYGERFCSMVGVVVVGVSALLAGLATSFPLVVAFRGAGGAGSSLLFAALYSYLLKIVPNDRMGRTMSVFYGSLNVGIIAGGPIGGLLAHAWGLASPLFVYSGLCLVSGVLYLRYMPNPEVVRTRSGSPAQDLAEPPLNAGGSMWARTWSEIAALLRRREFVMVIVLNMAFFWVVAGGYDTLLPLFAREGLGMSPVGVSAVFALAVAGEFLLLYPAGSAADRIGRRPVAAAAMAGLAIMMTLVGWAGTPVILGVLMVVTGFASGAAAATPAAMLSDVSPQGRSGTAVGVFRFAGDLGFVLGPLVAGATAGAFGFRTGFAVLALPLVLTLVVVLRTPETLRARLAVGSPSPARELG